MILKRSRVPGVILSTAVLLLASVLAMYLVGLNALSNLRQVASERAILGHLEKSLSTLTDAETGQRGYLLTGDEAYLEPYRQALGQVRSEQQSLQQLALRGALPQVQVQRINRLTEEKLAELTRTVELRKARGLDAAMAVVRSGTGKITMDEIRGEISQLTNAHELKLHYALQRADSGVKLRMAVFGFMTVVDLGILVWAYRRIASEVQAHQSASAALGREKELISTTLASIGDGVIVTDAAGRVTSINAEAERLTGWPISEAAGRPLLEIFAIINEQTRQPAENPVDKVLRTGKVVGLANHTTLIARDGTQRPIDDSAAPIRMADGSLSGVVLVFRDFSQQRAAQLLRARLAAIVEHSGEAIVTKDLEGRVQTWNAAAEQLFGYRSEEIVGKPVVVLFPPDRLSEEDYILDRLRAGNSVERLETIRLAKGGRPIPVSVSVSPIKDDDGAVIGASKIIQDITELVTARDALSREKELLATTLSSIGDAVIVTDAQGLVTSLNGEAERLTGWTNSEAAGRPLPDVFRIVNEETRQVVEDPVAKVLRIGHVVGLANHTVLLARHGGEIPIDDSAAPIRQGDGPMFGVVLVFRDFTERKEMESKLRSVALFPEQNPSPVLRVSREGTLLYANPAATRLFRESSLTLGQSAPDPVRSLATEALDTQKATERELRIGARSYVVVTAPIVELGYANLFYNDFTERKQAEMELAKAKEEVERTNQDLERRVEERTAKLQEMVSELQHVSHAMVHDMRAPLRAMQAFAGLVEQDSQLPAEERQSYLRRIGLAAKRLDKLVQEALNYNQAVLQEVSVQPVALGPLFRDLLETYPNLASENADIRVEGELPSVLGNESLLAQCFSNLLGNAVKFVAPDTRPNIRVWAEPISESESYDPGRSSQAETAPTDASQAASPTFGPIRLPAARIWIEDNGIGIPLHAQRRLFGMFQKLDSAYEGTGIGLAIVRKIVERMEGRVGVESEPGRGSRFWVELRIAEHPGPGSNA